MPRARSASHGDCSSLSSASLQSPVLRRCGRGAVVEALWWRRCAEALW